MAAILFPGLPRPGPELLLSATHLVLLRLSNIRHFGYISPKAMVTCLSSLSSLESLVLLGLALTGKADIHLRRHVLSSRFSLNVTYFRFKRVTEYSARENFLARTRRPSSTRLAVYKLLQSNRFWHPHKLFSSSVTHQRSRHPMRQACLESSTVEFSDGAAIINLPSSNGHFSTESLQCLNASRNIASGIAPALQELIGGRIAEVFADLQNCFLSRL